MYLKMMLVCVQGNVKFLPPDAFLHGLFSQSFLRTQVPGSL